MRIVVEDLPPHGRTFRFTADDAGSRVAAGHALDGDVTALDVSLTVERRHRGLDVQAKGHATVSRPCDRCGQQVELTVVADEKLGYTMAPEDSPKGEIELDAKDLDEGFFDGIALESDDVVSEAFALVAPLRVTCPDDACAHAVNLSAGAEQAPGHPAFAVLKKLL